MRRGEWALSLEKQLRLEESKLIAITRSNSWRITSPLREIIRWMSSPKSQTKRYLKWFIRHAKKLYNFLPFNAENKRKHRQWVANTFPRILLASGSQASIVSQIETEKLKGIEDTILNDDYCDHNEDIFISPSDTPLISIIIPTYGNSDYTLRCLKSISIYPPIKNFEVIIVDDCSPDNSREIISKRVKGIRIISNEENKGFIKSCNIGARAAKGEYFYFLNNDTQLNENSIDALFRTFSDFPGAGLVGSKLVYPDGRLQEAGGIIWQDGSAWNFGRFQDEKLPVFNYAREVDYCSGASIMVPKFLFEDLGGFDEHYLPAYCEDSDLALKIRELGYKVIYQPLSKVIHYEGISSGTDILKGIKSYQLENTKKLYKRWQDRLINYQPAGVDVDSAKDRQTTLRVLVLDHCTPEPNKDAGSVTVFNLLMLMREMGFQATFIPEDNFLFMPDYTTVLQKSGIEVLYNPYVNSVNKHLEEFGNRYDLVFIFRPIVMERYIKAVRKFCPNAKVLFHTIDLHYLRMSREAQLLNDKSKQKLAEEMQERELSSIRAADASIVHSTVELETLKPIMPKNNLHVFPLIMNVKSSVKPFSERKDIVFIGGFNHAPNVDAVQFFVKEVMPILREQLPGVIFYVVGSNPPKQIQALESQDIIIKGFVENLDPFLEKIRVSVAPLRYGAGIKGKIGTSMSSGLPVVATSIATEGMMLKDGKNILEAESADALADALITIYQDDAVWKRISENGLAFAENVWGDGAAWDTFAEILSSMGIEVKRSKHSIPLYSEISHTSKSQKNFLQPIGSVKNRHEYLALLDNSTLKNLEQFSKKIVTQANSEAFTVDGFCVPCDTKVSFLVDMKSGGERHSNGWTPNWRERLECPICRMNNRQRLMATLVKQRLEEKPKQEGYFMEQVTPIYKWVTSTFKQHSIIGSEYLSHEYTSGTVVQGIRHEDVENLSFDNEQLDFIVSTDVFEHVPNPYLAFSECSRVLKQGGIMLATIPFHDDIDISVTRAKFVDGKLKNLLPAVFHGNPLSEDGSLVFTDFGWDLIDTIKSAGFRNVETEVYADKSHCHIGGGQIVFRLEK